MSTRWGKVQVLLSDGAAWIRNMGEELFPNAVQILDFYHLAENLYSFGKYLFQGEAA
jgi:transposase